MKNKYLLIPVIFINFLFLTCTVGVDLTPTPVVHNSGSVWVEPSKSVVYEGDEFYFKVYVHTGFRILSLYEIEISFDETIINVITETGDNGVVPGEDGFFTSVDVSGSGVIGIDGNDPAGKGPAANLHLLNIHFKALTTGSTHIEIEVYELLDPNESTIQTPYGEDNEISIYSRKGWKCSGYDINRTRYYPYPSQEMNAAPFSFKWRHEGGANISLLTGDVAGDENLEIVCVTGYQELKIFSHDGTELFSTDFYPKCNKLAILADVDLDGKNEIGIRTCVNPDMECYFYDADGTCIKTLKKNSTPSTGGEYSESIPYYYYAGKVLVGWYTAFALYPRGLSLFDYETGSEEWYYGTGSVVKDPSVADIDGDGEYEITAAADTPHNGAVYNDTHDSYQFIIIINQDGTRHLSTPFYPDGFVEGRLQNTFLDFDNDGTMEILAYEEHYPPYYSGMSRLHRVDTGNGMVLDSYDVGYNEDPSIGLFSDKIVIANYFAGTVKILDYDFNETAVQQISINPVKLKAINDVNGDGNDELFIVSGNMFYLVSLVDENLNVLWTYCYNENVIECCVPTDLDNDGKNEIIIGTDHDIVVIGY